ncbi:MFS transporter [Nesterenkonia lutea]|uniref:MFS family permease n=1 Tax=Nesterenkonia lutea TaxID=272919 RepID=A0ABR9JCF2_9MICC|nr:MFS transporter [Nesterenkonia lutea]MBE1523610.1 MFS family permease [Nesterenkonia lutea]
MKRSLLWWSAVLAAGLLSAMTFPGQTAGLSVFTDPLIAELDIDRTAISLSYLVGTLIGASAQPLVGRALDRWDARAVIMCIGAGFALILFLISFVTETLGLTVGFIGVRMAGQGALSLAATTAVARAVTERRGLALGISAAIGSAGISLAPIVLERLISAVGVHAAWRWEALAVLLLVLPAAMLVKSAHRREAPGTVPVAATGWTRAQARRTGMFWVICAATSSTSMLSTALVFHQIAVLGDQGLSPLEAAANFLPQTVTALLSTLLVGALIDRTNPRIWLVASMAFLAASMLFIPLAAPGVMAILYGLLLGCAQGSQRGMEAASMVRYFGVLHIGSIRGLSVSLSLAASAFGPYALAFGAELAGGFVLPIMVLSVIPLAVLVAGLLVKDPRDPEDAPKARAGA